METDCSKLIRRALSGERLPFQISGAILFRGYVQEGKFAQRWQDPLLEAAGMSESLEPDVSLSRDPGIIEDSLWLPFEEYEREDAIRANDRANKILTTSRSFVAEWFSGTGQRTGSS